MAFILLGLAQLFFSGDNRGKFIIALGNIRCIHNKRFTQALFTDKHPHVFKVYKVEKENPNRTWWNKLCSTLNSSTRSMFPEKLHIDRKNLLYHSFCFSSIDKFDYFYHVNGNNPSIVTDDCYSRKDYRLVNYNTHNGKISKTIIMRVIDTDDDEINYGNDTRNMVTDYVVLTDRTHLDYVTHKFPCYKGHNFIRHRIVHDDFYK